jgi:dsRNA-specific ribonuclease
MGPHHSPIFKVNVQIPNSKKYSGSGNSKKKAQQEAAKKLLQHYNLL